MKTLYFAAAIILGLSSCTSYQYVSLKSELKQTEKSNHYYYQDENVYVDFDFSGPNFPVSIFLENTGIEPLYLDLEKTLFLENDVILRNAIPGNTGNISTFKQYEGQVSGVVSVDDDNYILAIPAGEKILMTYPVFGFPYSELVKMNSTLKTEIVSGYSYRIKSLQLPQNKAPNYEVDFYFYTDSTLKNGYDVITTFWPAKIYTQNKQPSEFPLKSPNIFYTSKVNKGAKALGTMTLLGLYVGALILMADNIEE